MYIQKTIQYFTFVGSYGGAVKYNNQWQKLTKSHGSIALQGWAKENNIQLERINCPNWAYNFEKYDQLPLFLNSAQVQKEYSNCFLQNKKYPKISVINS